MNPKYPFKQYLPLTAVLLAASLAGCGGGLADAARSPANDAVVGAPLGSPPAAAPGMGLLEPVPRYTALAVAAPAVAEEVASVWVRDENTTDPAPVGETDASGPSPAEGEPTRPASALQPQAPAQPASEAQVA